MAHDQQAHDREVGGIRCLEVLDRLPDFVDATLSPADVERVSRHLAGCDWCERFGGAYAETVAQLRRTPHPQSAARIARIVGQLD